MACAQSCNVQATDASGAVIVDYHNANIGVPPCTLQVTNNASVIITDANNVTWSYNGAPIQAIPGSGQITAGQVLNQVRLCALSIPTAVRTPHLHAQPSSRPSCLRTAPTSVW